MCITSKVGCVFIRLNIKKRTSIMKAYPYKYRYRVQCNGRASWLYSLGRLLDSAVGVEGLKLLLNSGQRVGQFPVVQHDDGLLDPRQQV